MSFGDAIGKLPVGGVINTGMTLYNFLNSQKALNLADKEYQNLKQLLEANLAQDASRYNATVRGAGELDATLRAALAALGPRTSVTKEDIDARRQQLERMYLEDINTQTGITASQNYAGARKNGMLDSTLMRDNQAKIAAAQALVANKARSQAYSDAASQLNTEESLINNNRANILKEYQGVIGAPLEMLNTGKTSSSDISQALTPYASTVTAAGANSGAMTRDLTETIKGMFGNKTISDIWS